MRFIFIVSLFFISIAQAQMLQNQDFKSVADLQAQGLSLSQAKQSVLHDTKIYVTSVAKTLAEAIADGDIAGGAGSGTLNLLEDPGFENSATEGVVTGGSQSLNASTILATPNNTNSLELNFNNVTGNYILEKNTSAQFDGVQGIVSVWIKNAKAGVKLIPRINGADSTALSVDVKTDDKWNEYVIPAVIGTTSFGFKVDVTASNAGSLFIDEATVGAMPATMTPEIAQAEYFGGLTAVGATNCTWSLTSVTFANFPLDADCNEFTEIGNIKKPSTKIPGFIIPAGSPSGTYMVTVGLLLRSSTVNETVGRYRLHDGSVQLGKTISSYSANTTADAGDQSKTVTFEYTTSNTDTLIQIQGQSASGTLNIPLANSLDVGGFDVYYYPPKSKIYSNKSMGWYVDVNIGGANPSLGTSNVSTYTSISNAGLDMVINPGSQPAQIPCSGTNPSTGITCSAGDEQIGVVFDIPSVGTYEVCADVAQACRISGSSINVCETAFQWIETPNNAQTNLQQGKTRTNSSIVTEGITQTINDGAKTVRVCGLFNFNSVGKKTLRMMYEMNVQGTVSQNIVLADRAAASGQRDIHITVKPFINNEQITASFKQIDDALQAIPNQNYVINGNFDFWQRGTSLSAAAGIRYLADRFRSNSTGTTHAPSRQSFTIGQTDVPNNPEYFHRTVIASSSGVSNFGLLEQRLEGIRNFGSKTFTLSFWGKADSNKQLSVEFFKNYGTGGSPSASDTGIGVSKLSLTSSWQKFTVTVNIPSNTGKTLGTNRDDYLGMVFWFDAGSNFNSRTDSLGHQSGTFDIAQVKLEEGSVATPFVLAGGTIQGELAACQRYYEKSYDINTAPGALTAAGLKTFTTNPVSTTNAFGSHSFSVSKRSTPVVSYYNHVTGTLNSVRNASGVNFTVISGLSSQTGIVDFNTSVAMTASQPIYFQYTADAEL